MPHINETTASHMPILLELFNNFKFKNILEFGSGIYSTPLLLKNCKKLISIEMESINWFNYIFEKIKSTKFDFYFLKTIDEISNIIGNKKFDFVFIDGHERIETSNIAMNLTDTIIVHDTQHFWSKDINILENFKMVIFKNFPINYLPNHAMAQNPWTTLFTKRDDIFDIFNSINEIDLYHKYKFPYIYDIIPEDLPIKE